MLPSGKDLAEFGDQCKTYFSPSTGGSGGARYATPRGLHALFKYPDDVKNAPRSGVVVEMVVR